MNSTSHYETENTPAILFNTDKHFILNAFQHWLRIYVDSDKIVIAVIKFMPAVIVLWHFMQSAADKCHCVLTILSTTLTYIVA